MSQDKKPFKQYDLLMTYLNENDDKSNHEILNDQQGCEQLDLLKEDMTQIENILNTYKPDASYGEGLWNRISDQLEPAATQSWHSKLKNYLITPQFSFASIFAVLILVGAAYLLGNKSTLETTNSKLINQLMVQNIQMHLTQTDLLLTQISNMNNADFSSSLQETASQLLTSNRMFSAALRGKNQPSINQLLNKIEITLLEISNSNLKNNPISNNPNSQSLLFSVKSMNSKLNHQDTSI